MSKQTNSVWTIGGTYFIIVHSYFSVLVLNLPRLITDVVYTYFQYANLSVLYRLIIISLLQ